MPKFVETPDGIIHQLPDSVTDENYLEEKEKFLTNYRISQPQEDFPSIIQPQPQPQPETSDTFSIRENIPGFAGDLLSGLELAKKQARLKRGYTEEDLDKSGLGKQIRGSFSKEFVELPNRNDLYKFAAKRRLLENERIEILSKDILTKEDKNRLAEIDKLINEGDIANISVEEADLQSIEEVNKIVSPIISANPNLIADPYAQLAITTPIATKFRDDKLGLNDAIKLRQDNIKKSVDFQSSIKYSKSFQDLAAATSFEESMEIFLSDPFNLMGQVLASSSAPMSKSLFAGVTGSLVGGPIVGAAATGITSGSVDAAYSFTEYMVKDGVNIDDVEEVATFMTDPEKVAAAKKYARTRATFIGAFDALSFGFGSRIIAPARLGSAPNRALFNSIVVQPPLQGALGGAGEYFAQLATLEEGEQIRVGEVFMEAIGEIAFAPVETTLAQAGTRFADYKNIQREAAQKQQERFNNFQTNYANLTEEQKRNFDIKFEETYETIRNNNPDKSTNEILDLTLKEVGITDEILEAQKIIEENPLENLAYNETGTRNETAVVPNQNGTFDVITGDTSQPNNFKVLRTYDNAERAAKVSQELNFDINTYVNRQTFEQDAVMQNLDITNPFVESYANNSLNTVLDGITFGSIEDAGVSPETIAILKDIAQNNYYISPEVLKANLSKKEFDAVMRIKADTLNAKPKKSISSTAFNTLLNNKNVESNINSDSFKRFALQFTGEQDVNKMSIAQKRVLFTLLENLPASPDKINLPDFTPRSFNVDDYNKAKTEIEKQGKATLKIIQEATGLNKVSAKRIMEYFVTAGYVNKKGNKFEFVGTENQIYNIDGTRRLTSDIEINKDIKNVEETLVNDTTINPNVRSKVATFLNELTDPNIIDRAGGSYNPIFNEILYTVDKADLNLLDKKSDQYNPKEFLATYARLQGHENFHALIQAGLFTQQEIDALTNYATNKKISSKLEKALQRKFNTQEKYSDKTYLEFATEQYTGVEGYESPVDILEEGMALVFEDYITTNAKITGRPKTTLQKISNFGKAVGNALVNNGFFTVEDIVDKTLQGKIADRNRGVSNRVENKTRIFNVPEEESVIVVDEPSLKYSINRNLYSQGTEAQIIRDKINNKQVIERKSDGTLFLNWQPQLTRNVSTVIDNIKFKNTSDLQKAVGNSDINIIYFRIIKLLNRPIEELREYNLSDGIIKNILNPIQYTSQQMFVEANNIYRNNLTDKNIKNSEEFRNMIYFPNEDGYLGFIVGEQTGNADNIYYNPRIYSKLEDAEKAAKSNNIQYNPIPNSNIQKIRRVKFFPRNIIFNPALLGSNKDAQNNYIINSHNPNNTTQSQTQNIYNLFFGNSTELIVSTDTFNGTQEIFDVETNTPKVKYSLRETNGRLIDDVKARLEEESGAPTLEGYFRQLYGTVASIPPPVKEFLKDARGEGSEYVAPLMTLGPKAFVEQRTSNRKNQGFFHYAFGYPNLSVNQAQQIFDGINFVTQESIKLFPEEIVVYRGSRIDDSYQLIPTTTNKFIAESFGKNLERRNERVEELYYKRKQDGTIKPDKTFEDFTTELLRAEGRPNDLAKYGYNVKKYLLPKEAIVVNMNALYRGESMLSDENNIYADRYNYIGEQELLVSTPFLIDEYGDTKGKEVLTTHIQDVNKIKRDRIIIQGDTQTITSGNFNVPKKQIKTLTRQELLDARADLFILANEPQYQRQGINTDDMYALVNHPAMLAAQNEATSIPDVYDNLTETQKVKRINKMIPELTDIAIKYAKGNLKYDKKAVLIIGPPATGKSTFAEDIAARKGYAIVDSDDAKKQMPEFKKGIGANSTHKFSKIIASQIQKQFIDEGANIIIPKVAGKTNNRRQPDISKIKNTIQDLQSRGYKVDIVYPDANINQSIVRAITRFGETGRFVNIDYLLSIDNKVRDSYNALKDYVKKTATPDVGFAYINNNYKLGEEIVEENTTELFQDDRIVDKDRSRSGRRSTEIEQETQLSKQDRENIQVAKEQEQNSIAAGVTPVINTNASPSAVSAAIEAQKEIKNSASENNVDVDSIISDIPNDVKLKYSFNKNNNPLNKNAEELIENLTVRDDTIESKTTGQLILEGFKSVDPLKYREAFIDQYARLAETDYKAGRKNKYGDKTLLASMSAGAALYFSDRSGDIFQQAFLRGVPVYDKNKGYTYVTDISPIDNQPIVPYFEVFKPAFKNPNLLWAFQAVQRVKRETRFNKEGRKVKVTAADRKRAKQALKDYPELQTMIDSYNRTNEHTVQFLVDTGVLDEKTGKEWLANSDYIPFYRPLEGMEGFKGPKIFQGLSITPFQRAKGSEEKDIVDPITGITNNLRAAINVGMKNIAANRVMRNMIDMGVAKKVKGNVKGPDIVTIRVKGKNVNYKVDDPLLFNSFVMMNKSDNFLPQSLFMNILRLGKRAVSDLITRVPDFWFRQIVRDSASASVLSGANYVPVFSSIKESFSIAKGMITGRLPDEFVKLRNAGVITGYDKGVRDIDTTEKLINNLYKNAFKKERPTAKKVLMFPIDLITTIWDIMGQGTAITDAATRVAVYKDTLKRTGNEAEAIFQALEVLNFTRRGNNEFFQLYAQSTMFLNPRLQGLDVFYRGLTGRYGIGRGLSRSKRLKSVLMRVAAMSSLSVYYYLLARDSEEYEEAPEQIKDNYLIIPGSKKLTGQVVAIPKPFEVGLLTMTVPERLTAYFMDDIAGQDVSDSLRRNIGHTLSLTLPTAVDPLVENYFNYDFFTKRQIVPDYLEGTGDLAYRPTTDTLSKKIGDELNMSPLYIENLFRSYSGTLGSWIMMATDSLIREGLTDAERVKYGIDQLPVVGTFLLPAEGSNFENQFYSLKGDVDDLVKTFRQIESGIGDKGDITYLLGMTDEYKIEYMDLLKNLQSDLTETADQLKEFRNIEARIVNSTTLSSAEKKAQLDNIRAVKNELLKGYPELRKIYLEEIKERAVVR
jgi:hypothetical protein